MPTCTKCFKSGGDDEFEYYKSEDRYSSWCRKCKWTFYRGFEKSARRRGPAGDAMRAHTDKLFAKFDWRCCFCGCILDHETITEDHVIPLARGGTGDLKNLQFACRSCNSSKQDREVE